MLDRLKNILSKIDADYSDLRYEIKEETKISFAGKELIELGTNTSDGYVLRVLKDGGLSSVAFTREEDAEKAIKKAQKNAQLIAKKTEKPVKLEETEIIKDKFKPDLNEDPRNVSIDEKLDITKKYNDIPLNEEKIITTSTEYLELIREKYFCSTEGTEIREDLITNRIRGMITSRDGNILQNVRAGTGGSTGFSILRDKEELFEKKTSIAIDLLQADTVTGGTYDVILNQNLAGVFTHEAFGHFSEADLIEDNPTMREKMEIGARLGNEVVNIKDNPTIPDQLGFYKYDDEGVRARPTQLMKEGVLVGRLHSRRTAAAFDEPLSGHCIAEDYRYAPIIRMGTIFIEPGNYELKDLIKKLHDGLYLLDSKGGQTSGENFTFGAQYGYIIENGKKKKMIRDVNISGNLYNTLQNITSIGNNLELCKIGGCGKGQLNIRSCHGAPNILIKNVVVGGK